MNFKESSADYKAQPMAEVWPIKNIMQDLSFWSMAMNIYLFFVKEMGMYHSYYSEIYTSRLDYENFACDHEWVELLELLI